MCLDTSLLVRPSGVHSGTRTDAELSRVALSLVRYQRRREWLQAVMWGVRLIRQLKLRSPAAQQFLESAVTSSRIPHLATLHLTRYLEGLPQTEGFLREEGRCTE
jgi:hypothetical protein